MRIYERLVQVTIFALSWIGWGYGVYTLAIGPIA
jgi:hypothetical protein